MSTLGLATELETRGVTTKTRDSAEERRTKESIPVVSHVITDDQVGGLPGIKLQPVNMNKTIKLLTDPHSAMLYDRHVNALRKIVKHYRRGFLMKDLVQVFKILSVCADRVEEQPCYEEPMCGILRLCALPFLCERASDETSYEQISTEAVSQLGYLMRVPSSAVRIQICRSIKRFYDGDVGGDVDQRVQHFKPASPKYNRHVVEQSDVSETLVKSLALLESEQDVLMEVLEVLMRLSTRSEANCGRMLEANAAYRICLRMNDSEPLGSNGAPLRTKGLFFMSVEILWNLLEFGGAGSVAEQLNNIECVTQLKDAFCHQLLQGFSHYDRQLRNDVLVLSMLVAKGCPKAPFVECGFAKMLVTFATFQEVKTQNALVRHLRLGSGQDDFELKKLLLHIIVVLSQNNAIVPSPEFSILSGSKLPFGLQLFHRSRFAPASLSSRPSGPTMTRRLLRWGKEAAGECGIVEDHPGVFEDPFIGQDQAKSVAEMRIAHSLIRKLSSVWCECRVHRCDGLPTKWVEQDDDELKRKRSAFAIYDPPLPDDYDGEEEGEEEPPPIFCECRSIVGVNDLSPRPTSAPLPVDDVFRFCFGRGFVPRLRVALDPKLDFEQKARGDVHFYRQDFATGRNDVWPENKRLSFFPEKIEKPGLIFEEILPKPSPSEQKLLGDLGFEPWVTIQEEEAKAAAAEAAAKAAAEEAAAKAAAEQAERLAAEGILMPENGDTPPFAIVISPATQNGRDLYPPGEDDEDDGRFQLREDMRLKDFQSLLRNIAEDVVKASLAGCQFIEEEEEEEEEEAAVQEKSDDKDEDLEAKLDVPNFVRVVSMSGQRPEPKKRPEDKTAGLEIFNMGAEKWNEAVTRAINGESRFQSVTNSADDSIKNSVKSSNFATRRSSMKSSRSRQSKRSRREENEEREREMRREIVRVAAARRKWWKLLSEGRILLALFSFLDVGAESTKSLKKDAHNWSKAQFEELQLQAIAALQTLAPLLLHDYIQIQGNTRLLLLLDWSVSNYDFFGHGNSFHGRGGRGNKRAQLRLVLQLARSMVGMKATMPMGTATEKEVALMTQDLVDQGIIQQLVDSLRRICAVGGGPGDEVDVDIQADMLHILATLCNEEVPRKEIFGGYSGVEMLVSYLSAAVADPASYLATALGQHRLLLALIDCLWSCVVGCSSNESVFLEAEGVFLLADLLEASPPKLRSPVLGVLLDLCETPSSISHLMAWRGSGSQPLTKLLCRIWREEESAAGVRRDERGGIMDKTTPLLGKEQAEVEVQAQTRATAPSAAIVDVAENQRAKIYAIFCKMGFEAAGRHPSLDVDDYVTLTIVDHYLDFKMAEVWSEVQEELAVEGVKPIKCEREAFETIAATLDSKAEHVTDAISSIVEEHGAKELAAEEDHYRWIHDNHRQLESARRKFQDFVTRTSRHEVLVAAKKLQDEVIQHSRTKEPYYEGEDFYDLNVKNVNITAFVGRHASVDPRRVSVPCIRATKPKSKQRVVMEMDA